MNKYIDEYMKEALKEARKAADMGEVPVGAVVVYEGKIIGRGHNSTETSKDSTCHGEIIALRDAANFLGRWRLSGCSMYVTLEPCPMCAGALVAARLDNLYIGADDPKTGACGSLFNITQDRRLNHFVHIERGMRGEESSELLKDFFQKLRANKKEAKKSISNKKENI